MKPSTPPAPSNSLKGEPPTHSKRDGLLPNSLGTGGCARADAPKTINRLIIITSLLFLLFFVFLFSSQAARIVLNNAYIVLNGGTSATPVYLVIDTLSTAGITKINGHIISEGEYNRVQWNLRTGIGIYTFPIGKNTTTFIPFVFNKTTAGTESGIGNVRIASWFTANNAVWPSGGSYLCGTTEDNVVDRFWQINVQNYSANPTATVDFYYNTGEIQTIPQTELLMQRWNSAAVPACKWETPPVGMVNTSLKYVRVTGISDFSPWAMTRSSAPLPIELLYFNANPKNNTTVQCDWTTASEINNSHFAIERSVDAVNFEQIGTRQGAGSSSIILNYVFYDKEPYSGTSYYRLKQVDYDGQYSYSQIRAVYIGVFELISIYPNPSSGYIQYSIASEKGGTITVQATDALGREVLRREELIEGGTTVKEISTAQLSKGCYYLRITSPKPVESGAEPSEKSQKQFVIE